MRHCVGSYAGSCHGGSTSIWSMKLEDWTGTKNMLTIEVRGGKIYQARGKRNEMPGPDTYNVMHKWAVKSTLGISSYIKGLR